MRGFPLVHSLAASLIDHALGVAEDDVAGRETDRLEQLQAGNPRRAGAVADELGRFDVASGKVQGIDQSGRGDDGGAVLIVMKYRNVEELAQALLDDEALGRADVFEIDAAPALPRTA